MSRAAAARATPAPAVHRNWLERWRDWRNARIADPAFQRWAAAFPLTRPLARRHARELFDRMAGFVYTQVLLACVRLRWFDALAEGALPLLQLAERSGLEPAAAQRLAAAAVSLSLLEWRSGGRVALGRLGAPMVGNRGLAAMVEHHVTLYGDLADPVALLRGQTRPAMAGYWPYADGGAAEGAAPSAFSAARVAEYSALMSASQPLVAREVLDAHDFSRHRVLLDVGGGEGTFLHAVAREAPALRLQLFDLPAVADRARSRFAAWGLTPRAEAFGGDFFADPLPPGADCVSLVRVCFDHPDERVLQLLSHLRRSMAPGATLVLAEPMADAPGAAAMGDAYFGFYLLAMGRGRPRSAAELSALLVEAGFEQPRVRPTRLPLQAGVIVARAPS